jgi:hypothetical protein
MAVFAAYPDMRMCPVDDSDGWMPRVPSMSNISN